VNRGSALVEALVLGALIVAAVGYATVTAGRLHAAGERATEAAQAAAAWAARHGDADDAGRIAARLAPDAASIEVARSGGRIEVVVRIRVALAGPAGPHRTVVGRAGTSISPYRSNRG
jgi:hypothetical protein